MADVLLVARLIHSLPSVFAVCGTPRDVDRIVTSLRAVVVARKLDRPLRIHLLHALQFLCRLQTGTVSINDFEAAVAATDLAVCKHHIVSLHVIIQLESVSCKVHDPRGKDNFGKICLKKPHVVLL